MLQWYKMRKMLRYKIPYVGVGGSHAINTYNFSIQVDQRPAAVSRSDPRIKL